MKQKNTIMARICLVFLLAGWLGVNLRAAASQTIKLAVSPWTGAAVTAHAAKIILEEELGYTVELVPMEEQAQFPALARGEISASLEVWPSGHATNRQYYIHEQKTVEDLGPLGVAGKIGWYIPTYMVERDPSLATWRGIQARTDLFRTAATGDQGQFLQGDPSWVYKDAQIISEKGLNLKIVQLGSEAALLAEVDAAYQKQDPILFYFWTPHAAHSKYRLTEVELPPLVDGCTGCDYPLEILFKIGSSHLRETAPAAHRLLKNFRLIGADQIAMIGEVEINGKTPEAAARAWLQQHPALVSAWLQSSLPPIHAAFAPPANPWAGRHLFVLDKDANGVFVNANNVYLESLQPAFPGLTNVANLIGRDDFSFYPPEQAEKFRADDRKVIAGDIPLTTVEVNEPVGGARTIVRVTKVPLRDEQDRIVGLRAIWHSHPMLGIRRSGGGAELLIPEDAGIFNAETRTGWEAGTGWAPLEGASTPPSGAALRLSATNQQGFFRLSASRPVKVGALLSLTGEWSTLGRACEAALAVGLEAVNLEELSAGSPLNFSLDIRDTKLLPDVALAELQSLAAAGVRFVIGPQSSAELRALKPFADANGIILISPGSTASSLAFANDNLFRFCPDDTYEGEAMAAWLRADGVTAIVPLWRDDPGNQGLHDSTARYMTQQRGVVYPGVKYAANQADFTAVIAALKTQLTQALAEHPGKTAIYLAGFDEVAEIFKLARTDALLSAVKWYGSDGVVQSQVLTGDSAAAQFALERDYPCPTFGLDDRYSAVWRPLATLIRTRSGIEVDAFTLAAYDALRVTALAYRATAADASFEMQKMAFAQIANGYSGATGPTKLNDAGDRAGGAFDFWGIRPGANGYIWTRVGSYQPPANGQGGVVRFP